MKDPFKPHRKKKKRTTFTSPSDVQSSSTEVLSSPVSDESCTTTDVPDDPESSRSQESHSNVIDFSPGSKLEVMDFNEKWYPVKVVEVDYEEGEVLIHFEKWSDKYDEWVPMDSNRIRQPVLTNTTVAKKVFSVNEKVIAVWAYNHKYPATVRKILPNDKYEVLFCDGYAKILRGCKLFKASEEDLRNVQLPPPKKPAPPMGADPLDPDLGPKEERRLKKRRLDVLEAYLPHKRQKNETPQTTPETSPQPSTSSYHSKEMPKVVLKTRGRPPLKKYRSEDNDEDDELIEEDEEEEEEEEEIDHEFKPDQSSHKKQMRKRKTKRSFEESKYVYRPKQKVESKEESERWNVEIPKGVSPVQIKNQEGYRESVIIPDKKLPPGWTKHTLPRKKGAKWDVLLVNPEGRKFRSRTDLRNYFAEMKKPFPEDSFDFMVGRKLEMIKSQQENRKKMMLENQGNKVSQNHRDGESPGDSKNAPAGITELKRIKTLMPKSRLSDMHGEGKEGSPGASPAGLTTPPFPLADVRSPDGGFTCCGKSFRKENLFQMHMKHYHPEYSNLFGSTPNVADLAYARTVGEPLEDSRAEEMTPKNSLVERVTKYEAERKALSDTNESIATSPTTATSAKPEPTPSHLVTSTPEPAEAKDVEEKTAPLPTPAVKPPTTAVTEDGPVGTLTAGKQTEEQLTLLKDDNIEDDEIEKTKEKETVDPVISETKELKKETETVDVPQASPVLEEEKRPDICDDKTEESPLAASEVKIEEPSSEPTRPSSPAPTVAPSTPSLPVIKPVSKVSTSSSKTTVTSEAVIVQTTSSGRTPVTITKYVPPGQKPVSSTTKVTISLPLTDKDNKPTIKTLLPMRPPTSDTQETQKPKEIKPKEESEEETPIKSKPRKRTVSESLPKKPKLVKPSTGSLEEEPEVDSKVPLSPSTNTSYRFSRNRTMPRVSLEKLNVTPNMNGSVVIPTAEDKITNTAGRRQFKNFKAANKISKTQKDVGDIEENEPNLVQPASESDVVYENLRKEEIINCICGYMEEDGLMIQCDLCLCWQHGMCNNIDKEADVPEKYVCYICQHPARQRSSTVHRHNQDWLKEGQLPSLSFQPKNKENVTQQETMLKKSHDLVSSLLQLQTVIQSLRVKTHIATKPDHPKLYLWAKSWKNDGSDKKSKNDEDNLKQEVSGPQPEAAIDETECRLQLLDHVEDYQNQVDDRLTSIQAQIAALESEDPDLANDETSDHYPVTKQTVQMVLRDLNTVRKVAAL